MDLSRLKLFVGGYAAFSVALVLLLLLDSIGTLRAVQVRSEHEHTVTDKLVDGLAIARLEAVQVQQYITDAAATGTEEGIGQALQAVGRAQDALNNVARLDDRLSAQVQQLKHDIEQLYITGQVMVDAYAISRNEGNAIMKAPNGFDFQVDRTVEHLRRLTLEVGEISQKTLSEQNEALERAKVQFAVLGAILCVLSVGAGLYVYRQIFAALNTRERALSSLHRVLDELIPLRESQGKLLDTDIEELSRAIVLMVHEREENRLLMQRAKEAAESSDRAKTEFLANLSHEVRTPLSGILGMADLIELGILDDGQTVAMEHLKISANSLLTLLMRMLDYSQIEAGKISIDPHTIAVKDFADSLISKCERNARAKGLEISSSITSDVPALVQGDEAHIPRSFWSCSTTPSSSQRPAKSAWKSGPEKTMQLPRTGYVFLSPTAAQAFRRNISTRYSRHSSKSTEA